MLDGIPECVGSMRVMLGYSYNTEDEGEIEEAKNELVELKPHMLAITSTEYKQSMIAGKAVMALGWNGDGAAVAAKKPAEYVMAEEGGEFWVDAYVIPTGAENRPPRTRGSTTCTTPSTTRSRPSTRTTARRSSAICSRR